MGTTKDDLYDMNERLERDNDKLTLENMELQQQVKGLESELDELRDSLMAALKLPPRKLALPIELRKKKPKPKKKPSRRARPR